MNSRKRDERTTVMPMSVVPASWRAAARFLKQLRRDHGDDQVIDVPMVHGEVVSYFADSPPGSLVVTAVEAIVSDDVDEEDGDA